MRLLITFISIITFSIAEAQLAELLPDKESQTYHIRDIFNSAIKSDSAVQVYYNDTISTDGYFFLFGEGLYDDLINENPPVDDNDRIIVEGEIVIHGNFSKDNDFIILDGFRFKKPVFIYSFSDKETSLAFSNCVFEQDLIVSGEYERISVVDNELYGSCALKASKLVFNGNRVLGEEASKKSRVRHSLAFNYSDALSHHANLDSIYNESQVWSRDPILFSRKIKLGFKDEINGFTNNKLDQAKTWVSLAGNTSELEIRNNSIKGMLDISNVVITDRIELSENQLQGYLDISKTVFPEVYRKIIWTDSSDFQMCVQSTYPVYFPEGMPMQALNYYDAIERNDSIFFLANTPYVAVTREEISSNLIYDLKRSYLRQYHMSKENTDLNTANWAYASMMDLEGKKIETQLSGKQVIQEFFSMATQ